MKTLQIVIASAAGRHDGAVLAKARWLVEDRMRKAGLCRLLGNGDRVFLTMMVQCVYHVAESRSSADGGNDFSLTMEQIEREMNEASAIVDECFAEDKRSGE